MFYRVKDLSPEQKNAAEVLLGHPISDDEAVSIRSLDPSVIIPSKLSSDEKKAALRAVEQRFAARPGPEISVEELDALVQEAIQATRRERRGH